LKNRRERKAWKKLKVQKIVLSKEDFDAFMKKLHSEPDEEQIKSTRKLFEDSKKKFPHWDWD
jgi:hypothetical protein